jgi:D-tyrosyl-tRNA(Tyr) deacylase
LLATVQIVSSAEIIIDNQTFSSIESGFLVFACIEANDSFEQVKEMTDKIINFRMLEGPKGITSRSLKDSNEEVLIVSQFTLAAITNKGTKPSFHKAAKPDEAKLLYDEFLIEFKSLFPKVKEGKFGAFMEINLVNKGPVTFNFKT